MNYRKMMLLFVVAGCADSASSRALPGVDPDETGRQISALVSANVQPCGYTHTDNYPALFGSPAQINHYVGRFTYNDRGDVILDATVDAADELSYEFATEYNAMGQPASFVDTYADAPTRRAWLTYDSFGRLIRFSGDDDGNETEDWVSTYAYGDDGSRLSAHHVQPGYDYDRTYGYDERGRLNELARDNGPDGVVDELSRYVYDDARRVITMTMTDPTGRVLETDVQHYDAEDHLVLEENFNIRNRTNAEV
jgi:YD repeat-containing protein